MGIPGGCRQQRKIGRSVSLTVDVTQLGYDTYVLRTTYSGYHVKRPSCRRTNGACRITRKPRKVGTARVGKTIRVRPPETTGRCGRIAYTWKADGTVIERGRSLHIGNKLRGKRLAVAVKPTRATTVTLRFGRAR